MRVRLGFLKKKTKKISKKKTSFAGRLIYFDD